MNLKFSIITPTYNSWNYMKEYWECLEEQSYANFEIIIIDDGSTDDTALKIERYMDNSPLNIRLFRNSENHGPGFSRNIGLDKARGEWILFVDSDDYISFDCLEKLYEVTQSNYDCIIFDYYIFRKFFGWKRHSSFYIDKVSRGRISVSKCLRFGRGNVCGKAYRLKALHDNSVSFPIRYTGEDTIFFYFAVVACRYIYYLQDCLYYYCRHQGSLSFNMERESTEFPLYAVEYVDRCLSSVNAYKEEIKEASVIGVLYPKLLDMCRSKRNTEIIKYIDTYEEYNPFWGEMDIVKEIEFPKRLFFFFVKHRMIILLRLWGWVKSAYTQ